MNCINCCNDTKGTCNGCGEPLCYDCNQDLNTQYGDAGDGKCWACRERDSGTYDGEDR